MGGGLQRELRRPHVSISNTKPVRAQARKRRPSKDLAFWQWVFTRLIGPLPDGERDEPTTSTTDESETRGPAESRPTDFDHPFAASARHLKHAQYRDRRLGQQKTAASAAPI